MKNIKKNEIDFEDLIKIKEKLDEIEKKINNLLHNTPGSYYSETMLQKKDVTLYAFLMAGKLYYNNSNLELEDLEKLFEEEMKYYKSGKVETKSNVGFYRNKQVLKGYDDETTFFDQDEDEIKEEIVLEIKRGN